MKWLVEETQFRLPSHTVSWTIFGEWKLGGGGDQNVLPFRWFFFPAYFFRTPIDTVLGSEIWNIHSSSCSTLHVKHQHLNAEQELKSNSGMSIWYETKIFSDINGTRALSDKRRPTQYTTAGLRITDSTNSETLPCPLRLPRWPEILTSLTAITAVRHFLLCRWWPSLLCRS